MKPTVRMATETITKLHSSTPPWVIASLAGALLGVGAQFLRQVPGPLMSLGASTAPWVTIGFLLAALASRGARTRSNAIYASTASVTAYLLVWLVLYHLLFVLRGSLPPAAGWREVVPWLIIAIPACPILGIIAALLHKTGPLGDVSLAAPIAWSLPEALGKLGQGWSSVAAIEIPVVLLVTLLVRMTLAERRVRPIVLLTAAIALGLFGAVVYPIVRSIIRS